MTSPGHYQVSAIVRLPHQAGQRGWEWVYGGQGLAFTANTSFAPGDASADPAGIPYFHEAIGATDSTHIVLVKYAQGHLDDMEKNNGFGNVTFSTITLDSISNTGGTDTLTFYPQGGTSDLRLNAYPVMTIRGSSMAGFNGQVTNVRNLRYYAQGKYAVDADQASSTGMSAPYSDYAQLTFGTTGYGNTQYTMRPMLQIIDVNRRPPYPSCYATGLSGCQTVVDGTIRLSATTLNLPTDGSGVLMAAHDYAMSVDYNDNYFNVLNPMAIGRHTILEMDGAGVNSNFTFLNLSNNQPYTSFTGYNGDQSIPNGLIISGLYQSHINASMAPAWGGSAHHEGCPAVGCTNMLATFKMWDFDEQAGNGALLVQPGLNLATFTSGTTWNFAGQVRVQGIPQYAVGSSVQSASTITILSQITHITAGTVTAIDTIAPPSGCAASTPATQQAQSGTNYGCIITLVPDFAFTTTTAGDIAIPSTAVPGRILQMAYDTTTSKWYPSY